MRRQTCLRGCYDGSLAWLDKHGVGHHDDGYDVGSASVTTAGDEDELAPYAQASAADNGNITLMHAISQLTGLVWLNFHLYSP